MAEQGLENSILDIKETVTNSYFMILVTEQSVNIFKKTIENLTLLDKGIVNAEDLPFDILSPDSNYRINDSLVLAEHYLYAKEHGMKALLEKIKIGVLRQSLQENDDKSVLVMKELKLGKPSFYNYTKLLREHDENKKNANLLS